MPDLVAIPLIAVLSYLLGSIPFSFLIGLAAGKDIRTQGSKNVGATNVWRVCGKMWGLLAFLLDFFKGSAAVLFVGGLVPTNLEYPYPGILAAVCVVLGHNFPIWLKFKGGKGVATSAGAVAGLMPLPFCIAFATFVVTVTLSHYISMGSMLSSVVLVIAASLLLPDPMGADLPLLILCVALSVMLIIRHRSNISRILAGTENRFPPPKNEGTQ